MQDTAQPPSQGVTSETKATTPDTPEQKVVQPARPRAIRFPQRLTEAQRQQLIEASKIVEEVRKESEKQLNESAKMVQSAMPLDRAFNPRHAGRFDPEEIKKFGANPLFLEQKTHQLSLRDLAHKQSASPPENLNFAQKWLQHVEDKLNAKENLNPDEVTHMVLIKETLESLKNEDEQKVIYNFVEKLLDQIVKHEVVTNSETEIPISTKIIKEIVEGEEPPKSKHYTM
jgi:hypothetical protein